MDVDGYESDGSCGSQMDVASDGGGSAATSYTPSVRSSSPSSVMTLSSAIELFKEQHGRLINTWGTVYAFPGDAEEFARMTLQHSVLTRLMGFKYVQGMPNALAYAVDPWHRKPACLDLGTGSGAWIIDIATDFPNCDALGVDLVPMNKEDMPDNLRGEIDDINEALSSEDGMSHFYDSFNVVHTRLISSGIRDYHLMINEIAKMVRSGGMIDFSEYDFRTYNRTGKLIDVDEASLSPPYYSKWMKHVRTVIQDKGGDVDASNKLLEFVRANKAFERIEHRTCFLPVVPPPATGYETRYWLDVEEDLRTVIHSFLGAGRPMLLEHGHSAEYLADLEQKIIIEIDERKYVQFTKFQIVYARRKWREHDAVALQNMKI